jgi:asparagine synthase (glutamine-hydrolysing)
MCGIFGVLQHTSTTVPPESRLQETARLLRHRGPDGWGSHGGPGVGLVHTRLSLVDLNARSNQPFWDRTGRYCLVYNGEIYNHAALRARLERAGVIFHTTSDTEVLLEALLHFGVEEALPMLEGMFAFALHDVEDRSLVLARDRFGIKPLFVHDGESSFVFSSEVRAMRSWVALEPDALTVSAYLRGFNGPMSGRSFYRGVTIVPPGAVVRVRWGGRAEFTQALTMNQLVDPGLADCFAGRTREQLVDHVEQLLLESVQSQLEADVPVGAFCSGGVDSSLIMAMAARSHRDLRVFHADITGPLSERGAAERLSRHLDLDLQAVSVGDQDFIDEIPHAVDHFGAPFANPTLIPMLMVSRLVRESGIKAVLTGEASDECFLGYRWLVPNVRDAVRGLPRRVLRRVFGARSSGPATGDSGLLLSLASQFENSMGPAELPGQREVPYQAATVTGLVGDGDLSYILRTLLYRNDTMGMASSVESRFPFLDSRVVQAAASLPYDCKIRFSPRVFDPQHPFYVDKWIVRQVAARYLPPELSHRPKGMFPTNAFQRMEIDDRFFDDSFVADWYGLARPRLQRLLEGASAGLRLRLMLLEAWAHVCLRDLPSAELSARLSTHVRVPAA